MRLAHLVPSYLPAVRYGGPIRSVHGLARGLVRLGHRVTVLTTNVDGPGESPVPVDRPVVLDGVTVRYVPVGRPRRIARAPAMIPVLRQLLAKADLVHLHAVWQWPTWVGARAAERAGIPYVLSPRGMLVGELIARKSALAKRLWLAAIERRTLARAAAIHATSAIEAAELRALRLDLAPVVEVPNGVDLPEREPDPTAAEAAWRGVPPGSRVLYLGRVSWEKGIDRLVEATALAPHWAVIIAGNDETGASDALRALAAERGIADRLRFTGRVEGDAKWALLAGADVLVLPSLSENWGLVVTEALGMGTPVVVTRGVGAAELVVRHELGAVVDGTPEALAAAIASLLRDPERRRAMGERGRRIVRERYSWDAVAPLMAEA